MRIIGIDTSTSATGVAIYSWQPDQGMPDAGELEAEHIVKQDRLHAEGLLNVVEEMLRSSQQNLETVDAFVVAKGPGSFTGLRIGVTMAKTMAQFTEKSVIGISTLRAMAAEHRCGHKLLVPLIDARSSRLYAAGYLDSQEPGGWAQRMAPAAARFSHWTEILEENLYEEEDLAKEINRFVNEEALEGVILVGEAIEQHPHLLEMLRSDVEIMESTPSPVRGLCQLSAIRLQNGDVDSVLDLTPNYLRKSQAEMERERKKRLEMQNHLAEEAYALGKGLMIRPLTFRDVDRIMEIEYESFPNAWPRAGVIEALENTKTNECYAILKDGVMIGDYFSSHVAGESSLDSIAYAKEVRGQGYGRMTVQHFFNRARARGSEEAFLECSVHNPVAQALYESMGFEKVGHRRNYYADDLADALVMRKDLKQFIGENSSLKQGEPSSDGAERGEQ